MKNNNRNIGNKLLLLQLLVGISGAQAYEINSFASELLDIQCELTQISMERASKDLEKTPDFIKSGQEFGLSVQLLVNTPARLLTKNLEYTYMEVSAPRASIQAPGYSIEDGVLDLEIPGTVSVGVNFTYLGICPYLKDVKTKDGFYVRTDPKFKAAIKKALANILEERSL